MNSEDQEWTFTPHGPQIDFMDMTIKTVGNNLGTHLFENLLPPTSTSHLTISTPLVALEASWLEGGAIYSAP